MTRLAKELRTMLETLDLTSVQTVGGSPASIAAPAMQGLKFALDRLIEREGREAPVEIRADINVLGERIGTAMRMVQYGA